jgi:hypothetical protein
MQDEKLLSVGPGHVFVFATKELIMGGPETGILLAFQASRETAAAAKQQGRDQQAANEFNAKIQERIAKEEEQKAIRTSQIHRENTRRIASGNEAAIGKGGISLEGSPLLALQRNAETAELDNFLILREGKLRSGAAREQGKLDVFKGKIARKAGTQKGRAIKLQGRAKLATDTIDAVIKIATLGIGGS